MTSVLFVLNNFVKKSIYDEVQWSNVRADLIRELVEINSFEFDNRNIYHRIFSFRNQLTFYSLRDWPRANLASRTWWFLISE